MGCVNRTRTTALGSLLFQNNFGLLGCLFFFAVIASDIAQRTRGIRKRAKFPQWTLSLRIGVGVRSTANERALGCQRSVFRVHGMICHAENLWLNGSDRCSLAECHRRR